MQSKREKISIQRSISMILYKLKNTISSIKCLNFPIMLDLHRVFIEVLHTKLLKLLLMFQYSLFYWKIPLSFIRFLENAHVSLQFCLSLIYTYSTRNVIHAHTNTTHMQLHTLILACRPFTRHTHTLYHTPIHQHRTLADPTHTPLYWHSLTHFLSLSHSHSHSHSHTHTLH